MADSKLGKPLGVSGLPEWGGWIYDEWLPELQSYRGRKVLREMSDNDSIIGSILFAIEMLIRQVEWRVQTGKQGEEDVAVFVDSCFHDMAVTFSDTLAEILSFLVWGWGFHETLYKRRDGAASKFSDGKIGWHSWPIRGQETLLRWEFDEMYQPTAMVQMGAPDYQLHTIPFEKGLLFRTTVKRNNPEGRSILRNCYRDWFFKKHIQQIEGIGIERDLAGLPVAEVPVELLSPHASDDEKATLAAIKQLVTSIRRDEQEGIVWPKAYDPETKQSLYELKLLSSGGQRQFETSTIIARYDQRIAMSLVADFILLGHEGVGSFALSETKGQLFTSALTAWLQMIRSVINEQAIPRLLALNGIATSTPPTIEHSGIQRSDIDSLGNYLLRLSQAGVQIDGSPDGPLARHLMAQARLPQPDTDPNPEPAKWEAQPGKTRIAEPAEAE